MEQVGKEELTEEALDAARRIYESSKPRSRESLSEAEQDMTSTKPMPPHKHNPAGDKLSHSFRILDESILSDETTTSAHIIPRTWTNPSPKESSRETSPESLKKSLHNKEAYQEEIANITYKSEEDEPFDDEKIIAGRDEIELDDNEVKSYLDDIIESMFSELDECKTEGKQSPERYSEDKVARIINLVKSNFQKEPLATQMKLGPPLSTTNHIYTNASNDNLKHQMKIF